MEQEIKKLYGECLAGLPPVGIDGRVKELRKLITKALKEGYTRETVERWLEQVAVPQGGNER